MSGMLVGTTLAFILNRAFTFRDTKLPVSLSAVRYIASAIVFTTLHGMAVAYLHDSRGLDYAISKLSADLMIITIPQLFMNRYVIFPKPKAGGLSKPEGADA